MHRPARLSEFSSARSLGNLGPKFVKTAPKLLTCEGGGTEAAKPILFVRCVGPTVVRPTLSNPPILTPFNANMMSRRRMQFGTRFLLLIPLVCASAYSGWTLNSRVKHRNHQRQLAEVERYRNEIQQLIQDRRLRAQYKRDALRMRIENAQHRQRIKSIRMQQLDPIGTRLSPGGF